MAVGICNAVYTCDDNGDYHAAPAAPSDPRSVELFFDMNTAIASPPQDQLDLKRDIERMMYTIRRLFLKDGIQDPKFRPYYVQLYNLAGLGLVGPMAAPEITRRAFDSVTAELIDSEGPSVKNEHLKLLAATALYLSVPCMAMYAFLRLAGGQGCVHALLMKLGVDSVQASGFMLLWVGCFVGVVLSYGRRTTKMGLDDLVVTDSDYLLPLTRHLFAGTFTMIMGILLCRGLFEVKLAGISTKDMVRDPMIAFLIGSLFGISELLLPGEVAKRAGSILGLKSG
jgi:hypothetical protein